MIFLFIFSFSFLFSQQELVDGVVATVGNKNILFSEVLSETRMLAEQKGLCPQESPFLFQQLFDTILKGAVNILYRNDIKKDPDLRERFIEIYEDQFANPYLASDKGYIDEVIDPSDTRNRIIDGLDLLATKTEDRPKRKHGNIPL